MTALPRFEARVRRRWYAAGMSAPQERALLIVAVQGTLVAVDRWSGQVQWRAAVKGGGDGVPDLAIAAGRVFAAAPMGQLTCLDYATGRILWHAERQLSQRTTLLVEGGQVFLSEVGLIECFSLEGAPLWRHESPFRGHAAMAVLGASRAADDTGG